MQCFPPSPLMNGFDPQWMMHYPMTPIQNAPLTDQHFHSDSHKGPGPDPHSPTFYPDRRTITLENLHPSTTPSNLQELIQSSGTVKQCNLMIENNQTRASLTMQTNEEAYRAVTMFNNVMFMGSRIRVKLARAHPARNASFDSSSIDSSTSGDEQVSWADEMTTLDKIACKPLVIDGSGMSRSGSMCMSAPT